MAGMQFEYDEEGGTFFYFLLSFWGLVIIPATYYLWPRSTSSEDPSRLKRECRCSACQVKRHSLKAETRWSKLKERAIKIALLLGWVIFIMLAYKVSKIQLDYVEYDPYVELGLDRGATQAQIKKAYRKLSLVFHPDKKDTGDPKKFMRIAKAYAALTDEEVKKNWEEYGNPDGPGVMKFGIALPKWIVEEGNSMWVLAAYGLIFMVILPVVVGVWWYRSIKFSKDQVLLDTTRLYYYFFQKNPNMILKRVIMVLAGSFEFDKFHNAEIIERPSDNEEVPQLIKRLPNLDEKNKEKPLCYPYSVKARALLHAHFQRLDLPPNTLEIDRQYVLKKSPYLLTEMINITAQLVAGAARKAVQYMPRLETVENIMKVSQMLTQGLDQRSSPLLQLPHIAPDMLKHFTTKKRHIQGIRDLISMKEEERKSLLRHLGSDEYRDVMNVCATMPHVTMVCHSTVLDDDDPSITAGSIVTVIVNLKRENMEVLFDKEDLTHLNEGYEAMAIEAPEQEQEVEAESEHKEGEEATENHVETLKPKVWKQQQHKKPTKKKGAKKPKAKYDWKAAQEKSATTKEESKKTGETSNELVKKTEEDENADVETDDEGSQSESEQKEQKVVKKKEKEVTPEETQEDDEEQWAKYQEEAKKEQQLDTKVKESHPVHCPYFPEEKQEGWWLYVADRKGHMLITAPVQILSLKSEEELTLKFSAPLKPGSYTYTVILRSDSYFDFDQTKNIKLDVKEAKVIEDHPQWDISDDEDDKDKEDETDSDYSTEEEGSEYE
ncbi:hypothetical protein FSP39_007997 [Pinctada imbricata]|uniref:J domain-containing protein n=1 Tax=Pinctada imbricata TaxID=66713 RepID=A0AA89BWR2_PINIB|nr:hypothetical protein FSP39_007997 [Pinctada imbricata]